MKGLRVATDGEGHHDWHRTVLLDATQCVEKKLKYNTRCNFASKVCITWEIFDFCVKLCRLLYQTAKHTDLCIQFQPEIINLTIYHLLPSAIH